MRRPPKPTTSQETKPDQKETYPFSAVTCAIPAPINPAPTTATVSMAFAGFPYLLCFSAVVPVKIPRKAALTLVAASSAKRVASYSRAWGLEWERPYLMVSVRRDGNREGGREGKEAGE